MAQAIADVLRLIHRLKIIDDKRLDKLIDELTVRVLKAEIEGREGRLQGFCKEDLISPVHGWTDEEDSGPAQ